MDDAHLWEVQGSYWHAVPDHGKGGWRNNLRLFVLTDTATSAIKLWTIEACQRERTHEAALQPEIHQVIRRMDASAVIIDRRLRR